MSDSVHTPARESEGPPCVLIPVFNDWESLTVLLGQLDAALREAGRIARVVVIDDGSSLPRPPSLVAEAYHSLQRVEVLELRRNLGHQRALAIGLAWAEAHVRESPAFVIMDGDGEDAPRDVPRLLARFDDEKELCVVFAERRRRSESLAFRAFYLMYRAAHRLLTGRSVRVGNFSVLPRALLHRLVVVSELWNHYAAAVFKARLPNVSVPTARARRIAGRSRMNTVDLVTHGLSAMSVYSETIGVRALAASLAVAGVASVGLALLVLAGLSGTFEVPFWLGAAGVATGLVLLQATLFSLIFSFTILSNRHGLSFLPARDYAFFVGRVQVVFPRDE